MNEQTQRSKTLPPMGRTARLHPITGLLSRQGFADAFDCDLALVRRYGMPMALVSLQVEGVESDASQWADETLLAVSDALHALFRASDKIGHLTGGLFVVSLLDANEAAARRLAEQARQAIEDTEVTIALNETRRLRAKMQFGMAANEAGETFDSVFARLQNQS